MDKTEKLANDAAKAIGAVNSLPSAWPPKDGAVRLIDDGGSVSLVINDSSAPEERDKALRALASPIGSAIAKAALKGDGHILPVYQYCSKAAPYIRFDGDFGIREFEKAEDGESYLNGSVCGKCLIPSYLRDDLSDPKKTEAILADSRVEKADYFSYSAGKPLLALRIEDEEALDPIPLATFSDSESNPIEAAPESWRFAYVEIDEAMRKFADEDLFETIEIKGKPYIRCVIMSMRSHWMAELLSGRKTREIRKRIWDGPKEEK
jgi:hypothetical protein